MGGGEMWFPPDIRHNELGGGGDELLRLGYRSSCSSMAVDSLSDQLSLISLLQPKPRTIPRVPTSLESLRPQVGFLAATISAFDETCGGSDLCRRMYGRGRLKPSTTDPFNQLHLPRTAQTEIEMFYSKRARAMVLQRQQTLLQNRGMVQRSATVSKAGDSTRESVGTGVFHPFYLHGPGAAFASSWKKRAPKNRQQTKNKSGEDPTEKSHNKRSNCFEATAWLLQPPFFRHQFPQAVNSQNSKKMEVWEKLY